MSLTAEGKTPLTFPIFGEEPVPAIVTKTYAKNHHHPEDYFFKGLWFKPLVDGLTQIWGPQTLVWALDLSPGSVNLRREIDDTGPVDEVVTALIYALQHESRRLRVGAVHQLAGFAPEAEEAIPFLVTFLKSEGSSVGKAAAFALKTYGQKAMIVVPALINIIADDQIQGSVRVLAVEVLVAITGQAFGGDVALWRQWWDEQQ